MVKKGSPGVGKEEKREGDEVWGNKKKGKNCKESFLYKLTRTPCHFIGDLLCICLAGLA